MVHYLIDPERIIGMGRDMRQQYAEANPFPHIVIDDFFPQEVIEDVVAEFPGVDTLDWKEFKSPMETKLASNRESSLSPAARRVIWEMNSQVFLQFLQELTGIENLIADPQLRGGGMHQIERGGNLGVHVDFNRHPEWGLDRRLNAILYLNKDWSPDYGGQLELWDRDMTQCVKRVLPVFNRLVVFTTDEQSWHGHPDPLECPPDRTRKSLALYYYTNGRPDGEKADRHTTVFRSRDGSKLPRQGRPFSLRDLVPPIMMRGIDRLRGKPV